MSASCTASVIVGITDGACRTSETAKLCCSAVMQASSTVASIHTFYLYLLQGEL